MTPGSPTFRGQLVSMPEKFRMFVVGNLWLLD